MTDMKKNFLWASGGLGVAALLSYLTLFTGPKYYDCRKGESLIAANGPAVTLVYQPRGYTCTGGPGAPDLKARPIGA